MNVENGIQIGDLWGVVRRRGKLVGGTAMVVTLAAYWVAMALPNEYSSYATVLVTPQTVAPELVTAGVPASDLNERLHLMTAQILSRGRLSRIIDDLDLYPDESEYMVRNEIIDLMRENVRVMPVVSELTAAAQTRKNAPIGEINQFQITFTSNDAETAMRVAQQLSNDFIEQHIDSRINLSQKSLEFIDGELQRLAERIRAIEAQVAEVKAANSGRLPEDMRSNQHRLEKLTTELAFSQREHAMATSDEAFYRSQISNAQVVIDDAISPARRLQTMDLVLAELKARGFTGKHPDVVKALLEIDELKLAVARQEQVRSQEEQPMTPVQQNSEAERRRAALRRENAEDEIVRAQSNIDEVETLLAETPAVAELLDGLEREYHHLFNSFQDFSNRQLEATVQAQLERRQLGEQFRVLEAAFIAPAPTSPNRILIVLLGAIFAIGMGAVAGILFESVDGSLHSSRQLQNALGIPVLAAIPKIQLEVDLAMIRRSRIKTAFGTVAVVVFALSGGAMNYMWVNGAPAFLSAEETSGTAGAEEAPASADAAEAEAEAEVEG